MMSRQTFIKTLQILAISFVIFLLSTFVVEAQQSKPKGTLQNNKETNILVNQQIELAERLIKSTEEYKESLQKLASLYQNDIDKQREKLQKKQELFQLGIIARRELENAEEEIKIARNKLLATEKELVEADNLLVEAEAAKELATLPPITSASAYRVTSGVIRYSGFANWSLQDTPVLQKFFQDNFSRALPISAYGQSHTHDRLGYDHRNSIDIAVHPEGAEGQALINFLRNKGIPFQAFSHAIAGSSTGPHIHIGKPSVRIN
jgi:hypothetical protein